MKEKKMLVTCALPYANGSIHLGHMLEHIQADIWVRYHRMKGCKVYFICADDAHGTPIMLKAKKMGLSPEEMVEKMYIEHKNDLSEFKISYDNYHSTHSYENYALSTLVYETLKKNGFITSKSIHQLFDNKKNMFLSDRLVRGSCPKCFSKNQYGDICEICGATYSSKDLINPKSILSKSIPTVKESKHLFFNLPIFEKKLKSWIQSIQLQEQVFNKLQEWFKIGLKKWDISRDAPYFGFKFPDEKNKYFYVWLDATIGYMGAFKNLCLKNKNIHFNDFWKFDSETDLFHFIGKDIMYFHYLFWPALLEGIGFRKPTNLFVHGYVLLNGKKMSKSKGTLIKARTYLKNLDSDCLRYYYASKLSLQIADIDLNLEDFLQKVNTDIVNKLVNLAARNASIINFKYKNKLSSILENSNLFSLFVKSSSLIEKLYEELEIGRIVREVMKLTDIANRYIDEKSPWILAKRSGYNKDVQSICSMGIELFRILMIYLKPIVPSLAEKSEKFLNSQLKWGEISFPLGNHCINNFNNLFSRIKKESILKLIN